MAEPRRRGRPPKQQPADEQVDFLATLDVGDHADALDGEVLTPPQPGKLRRTKVEPKQLSKTQAQKAVAQSLNLGHSLAAKALNEEALKLSPDESRALAIAIVDLMEVHGIAMTQHPKLSAWIAFLSTAVEVEGPRVMIVLNRPPKRRHTPEPEEELPPLVVPLGDL